MNRVRPWLVLAWSMLSLTLMVPVPAAAETRTSPGAAQTDAPVTADAAAPELPALYDLRAAAAGGVEVRAAPGDGADTVGALPAGATGIEIVQRSEAGDWGRVNLAETSGWVRLDALAPRADGTLARAAAFRCLGTEPFWSLAVSPGGIATFRTRRARRATLPVP